MVTGTGLVIYCAWKGLTLQGRHIFKDIPRGRLGLRAASSFKMAAVDTEFPTSALLPKKETGASSFLSKYPEYDGRGITIAILDSGVDPGAVGLKVTSEGKPKVVERYDCTGAGDVNISKVVKAENGEIKGLTGRKLKIPDNWNNPSGSFHIGVKPAYELYSPVLKERVLKDRKEKNWDPAHKLAIAEVTRAIHEFESSHPASSTLSGADKLAKEDLDLQLEVLTSAEKKFYDPGPCYDCVVFHDGDVWRACIDTSECGNLADSPILGEYNKTLDYKPLTGYDQLNVSINVHDDGKILEIVSMCSSHGTHVAAIAAACHPDEPEKNGLAPGAQIVSLMIGDSRVDSMETGTGLVRAVTRLMKTSPRPIHLINMSYGEFVDYSLSGRVRELMLEVVDQHNIVWICSAGNNGPAVSTVSTPPNLGSDAIIGVGAFVTPDMMAAEYSLRQKQPGLSYTWTSRGPTPLGDMGVAICSPGGAITSVPNFMLRNAQLMNGTSMASPNVCGAVACLLSGMKIRNLPYTPYSVRRALENSAIHQSTQDYFAQGQGLLQVEGAWEHLSSNWNGAERNVRFQISCPGLLGTNRGIYIRESPLAKPKDIAVTIEPIFHQSKNLDVHQDKIHFNMKLALVCDQSWVSIPSHLNVMNMARNIIVRVDTTPLPTGIHYAQVRAYDVDCVEKGPVFRIPITVIQPIVLDNDPKKEIKFTNVSFSPSTIQRHFIAVPEGATWAVVRMIGPEKASFMVHALQLRPFKKCRTHEHNRPVTLTPNVETVQPFAVRGGLVMELAVAKHWADLGEATISYSLSLSGVKPDRDAVLMHAGGGIQRLEVQCPLRAEEVLPIISLKNSVQICRPNDSKIVPLSPTRDVLPPGRQIYELQLSYNFSLSKGTEVIPRSPLCHLLYESEYESQLWMLFNSNKQFVASGDAYAEKYSVKLEKGDYSIRLHVRHDRRDLLEKLTDHPIAISQKLPSPVSLDVYATESQAVLGGKKITAISVPMGSVLPIYITPIANDKFSKNATLGQYLCGSITYAKDELGKRVCVYPFRYLLTEAPKKSSSSNSLNSNANNNGNNNTINASACSASNVASTDSPSSSNGDAPTVAAAATAAAAASSQSPIKELEGDKSSKTKHEEYMEAVRDLKTSWLSKLEGGSLSDCLYLDLKVSFPDHLPIHVAMLNCLEPSNDVPYWLPPVGETPREVDSKKMEKILDAAQDVIDAVDQNALLAYYGLKTDDQIDAAKVKASMDRQKVALLESLSRRGIILCRQLVARDKEAADKITQVWKTILKFTDAFDSRVIRFSMWHAFVNKHYGRLLRYLSEEKPSREVDLKMISVMRILGWEHYARLNESTHSVRFPPSYRPF